MRENNIRFVRQIVLNSPLKPNQVSTESLQTQDVLEAESDQIPEGLFEENEVLSFEEIEEIPEGATFGICEKPSEPVDSIPWDKINPEYHAIVRHLFVEKYPHLLSRHNYDCGDISKTLGEFFYSFGRRSSQVKENILH